MPKIVTVSPGGDLEQDILKGSSAQPLAEPTSSWDSPAALPESGDWNSSFNAPGDAHYFLLPMQANRTLSVAVTALDETGAASLAKVQPVIGIWPASDLPGTPPSPYTSSPFNQSPFGMTRLDAVVNASGNFLVGISDARGDGRPDYHYHAPMLYADSVSPARIPVTGAPMVVQGTGFGPGFASAIGASKCGTTCGSGLADDSGCRAAFRRSAEHCDQRCGEWRIDFHDAGRHLWRRCHRQHQGDFRIGTTCDRRSARNRSNQRQSRYIRWRNAGSGRDGRMECSG